MFGLEINLMIHLPHILGTGLWGLVKPEGGLQLVPAIFGLIAIIQVSSFHWYAREKNEPTDGWGL